MIIGDFNLPKIEWCESDDEGNILLPNYQNIPCNKQITIDFIDSMLISGHNQLNKNVNVANNVLDLAFTNNPQSFEIMPSKHPLVQIDVYHVPLELTFHIEDHHFTEPEEETEIVYCYKKTDFEMFGKYIEETGFDKLSSFESIDDMVDHFYNIIERGIIHTPKTKVTRTNRPRYFTKELTRLKNLKNKAHKEWKVTGDKRRHS